MRSDLKENYEEQMFRIFGEMERVDVNSDDYKNLVTQLDMLYKTIAKDEEVELESRKAAEEMSIKLKESKLSNWIDSFKIAVEFAAVTVPAMVYYVWMKKGLEFEKTGTFTSTTFKGLIGKFKPGK